MYREEGGNRMVLASYIILIGILGITVLGRTEKDCPLWKRGARRILRFMAKKTWMIGDWMEEKHIAQAMGAIAAGCILTAGCSILGKYSEKGKDITALGRPEVGQGNEITEMCYEWVDETGEKQEDTIQFQVEERRYTEEEKQQILEQAEILLEESIWGENESPERVVHPLCLPERIGDIPVGITWSSSHPQYLDWSGVLSDAIPAAGVQVKLQGLLEFQGTQRLYQKDLTVFPEQVPEEEALEKQLELMLKTENEQSGETFLLPVQAENRTLTWSFPKETDGKGILLASVICSALLLWRGKQQAEKKKQERKRQLLRDYPDLLSKLTLLLGAGVSMRRAMQRIALDYEAFREGSDIRYAYEEIRIVCKEMEQGIPERIAYQRMGERCGLLQYRTFAALLVQNLQKGSPGMAELLQEEAMKAQYQRQDQARILGEQASAKLLIPMVFMLLVVFVILIVPAWLTFL